MKTHGRSLLEREVELDELRAAVEAAVGGAGRTVLIEGQAGVGKSALLSAALTDLPDGTRVLRAAGSEIERDFAFGAVRQLFEPVLVGASESERAGLLAGSAAPAAPVFGLEHGDAGGRAEFAVLNGLYWLAAGVAERPLVLAVDDLHWVDDPSLRALEFLALRLSDLPVALVATLRPADPGAPAALLDAIRAAPAAVRVTPAGLSRAGVAALVRRRAPQAGDEVCDAFHESCAGNPLYLRELVLATMADGLALDGDAHAVRRATVPALADRLARRIASVAPEAVSLATAMAVLGDGSSLRLAAAMAGMELDAAARLAQQLTDIEVLASDDPFAFAHPVLRRSLYDRLTPSERERIHADAARVLRDAGASAESIAAHVSAVPPAGSETVVAILRDAARLAISRAAPAAAIPLLRRALGEGAEKPPATTLLHELGRAEMSVRDPACLPHLREAFEAAPDARTRALVAIDLSELTAAVGMWDECLSVIGAAKSELGDGEPELMVELETLQAVTTAFDPRGIEDFDRSRPRYEDLSQGDSWPAHALAAVLSTVALIRSEGRERVSEYVDRTLRGGRFVRERGGGGWAAPQLLPAMVFNADYDRALEVSDQIAAVGRRSGALIGIVSGLTGRAMVQSRTGDLVAAEATFRTLFDLTRDTGMTLWLGSIFNFLIDVVMERPGLADTIDTLNAIEVDPAFAASGGGAQLLEARGRLALALGDRERGLADLRACAPVYERIHAGPGWGPWRSVLALAIRGEDASYAERLVGDELELAHATGIPEVQGSVLRTAGILAAGDSRIELLRQSVATLEPTRARLEHARSLIELGAALRRCRHRAEARELLEHGMDLAHRCGAVRLVERAGEELRATGARPRRAAQSGVAALTASELRVARLALEGRSNVEIAQELFVTTKTVETHLSQAYAKLGLSGRGARERLRDALG